ncbi:MAG TPA: rhomboid family intramembrane serine protease [Longimicrobium sp.]|nr:rhomboid family intramembrane serine protease [Longimicrobium sp.]
MAEGWKEIKRELKLHGWMLAVPLGAMWVVQLINALTLHSLDRFGIHPWSIPGLIGILFAPFLHGSFGHLLANSLPFLLFGWLILLHDVRDFVVVSLLAMLVGGLGTWLTGAPGSVHIGASGVIFGYFGFLLLRGWFRRSIGSILLSLLIGIVYGGLVFGVLPGQAGISWQGHLFGFLGGGLSAWMLCRNQRQRVPVPAAPRVAVR